MKTTSLLSLASLSATALAAGCNVDGNLFQLQAFQTRDDGSRHTGSVKVTQIGDLGTDSLAHFNASSAGGPETSTAVFYLNTDNNRLIVLDPFNPLHGSNAYTDVAEGGELKFTFYNDTSRPEPYHWPVFGISEADDGKYLTVDGDAAAFKYCPTDAESPLLTGSIALGTADVGKDCVPLDVLQIYQVTSQVSQE
ncbi:hypothetical protein ASPVEDRAFT_29545 [Aspergillus versicolor CBS 583.65]|uniref:Cell wall protein PhiA n=1 Tax=Aspergillus versicolor CBS 583.65 TaxID=1036611 RepID=A0A1L9PNA9_ASPVE|nr:uncharacterized protein ASPVEDRAFT_29545 [Aspergillus versicolor CBS 583.65]OJJ03008.1 hypothetical protein ASPVEDRAFT_29545 [Aspergillus versicolor CBS 583.65]